MKKINNSAELDQAIEELKRKAAGQRKELEESFALVSESLKPLNLIKSGVNSVFSGENKGDLLNALIGLGTGLISRRLLLGKSNGFLGKTVGRALEWGMAGIVSKNAEKIKEKAGEIIDKVFKKNKPDTNHLPAIPSETGIQIH